MTLKRIATNFFAFVVFLSLCFGYTIDAQAASIDCSEGQPGLTFAKWLQVDSQGFSGEASGTYVATFNLDATNELLSVSGSTEELKVGGDVNASGTFLGGLFKVSGGVTVNYDKLSSEQKESVQKASQTSDATYAVSYKLILDPSIPASFSESQGYLCQDGKVTPLGLFAGQNLNDEVNILAKL